ncbi:MAG: hypothetical protein V3U78_06180 [Thiotrichaceae bacterium]
MPSIIKGQIQKISKLINFFNVDIKLEVNSGLLSIIQKYYDDVLDASVGLEVDHCSNYICDMTKTIGKIVDEFGLYLSDDTIACFQRLIHFETAYHDNLKKYGSDPEERRSIGFTFTQQAQLTIGALERTVVAI